MKWQLSTAKMILDVCGTCVCESSLSCKKIASEKASVRSRVHYMKCISEVASHRDINHLNWALECVAIKLSGFRPCQARATDFSYRKNCDAKSPNPFLQGSFAKKVVKTDTVSKWKNNIYSDAFENRKHFSIEFYGQKRSTFN